MANAQMKAVQMHEYGTPDVLSHDMVDIPELGSTDVLVRVRAVGVNPHDLKVRDGTLKDRAYVPPLIFGYEVAGVIEAVGTHAFRLRPGDEVFGYPTMNRPGAYAEFVAIDESSLTLKPSNISFEEAAAFPVGALTAFQGLFGHGRLRRGQKCLVHAGAGAVGSQGVQLAALEGAHVVATAGPADLDYVRSLGAQTVIDYRSQDFERETGDLDVVLDLVGGDTWRRSLNVLKPGGHLVSVMMDPAVIAGSKAAGKTGHLYIVEPSGAELERIAGCIEDGKLKARIDTVFPIEDVAAAHRHLEAGKARGKVVLRVSA